jgi:short-subunit dehydrogenase
VSTIDNKTLNQPLFLALLVRHLAALNISNSAHGQSVMIVEPDFMFHDCINEVFGNGDSQLRACSTDATRSAAMPGTVYLHPSCPMRELKALYPSEGAWIIDMSTGSNKLSDMLVQTLPKNCKYTTYSAFLGSYRLSNNGDNTSFASFWEYAVELALSKAASWKSDAEPTMTTVPAMLRTSTTTETFQIVDWKAERQVSQVVKPLAGIRLLNPNKTYVLVGLTRDFGQSLCTLFVQQGARNIVLCSRNPPKVQPKWQTEMLAKGITVRFEPLDVTSLERVTAFKAKLAETLPPVGGVVNGAMVLEDRVFSQMSLETLQRVMNPKTVGSKNLDMVFNSPDMDFFVMTSSFAAIGGHAGQSNYAAANMYMNGLAADRRRRGLPGSVLNIGVIYGLGFLHREKDDLYEGLEREGYPPISERDIHHMFVEAIAAGKPNASPEQEVYDITTGLRRFPAQDPSLHWHSDPRFSHFTKRDEEDESSLDGAAAGADGAQKQSLKELMDAATTADELTLVLVDAFVARLQSQLQLDEGSVTGEHSIAEFGVDSLAAVQVRAWVWRAFGQDIAVMKLVGGGTIAKLCEEIAGVLFEARGVVKGETETETGVAAAAAVVGGGEERPVSPGSTAVDSPNESVGGVSATGSDSGVSDVTTVLSPVTAENGAEAQK